MGQSQSAQTPQPAAALSHEPNASKPLESPLDSVADVPGPPHTVDKGKRRLFKRRSQASVSSPTQPQAPGSASHDAAIASSSKPAHKRTDSQTTIIGSSSNNGKRKRWSLGGRTSSNASTQTLCAKQEDQAEPTYPRTLIRRLTSGRKSRYPSDQLPSTSDQPEEEEMQAVVEDNDRAPGSELSDPLAEDRRKAQEMITAALGQAESARVATVTDSRVGRVAAAEDSRVRMTNDEDDMEPPLEIIPIMDESNQPQSSIMQTPPLNTLHLPEPIDLPSPRSTHSSTATITRSSTADQTGSEPSPIVSQPSAENTPTPPQTRPQASRRILVQGTIQTIVASGNSESSNQPSSNVETNVEIDCFTLENTFMSSDSPLSLHQTPSETMPDFGTAASQAIVISRLLSVAAAATAGSLLPGSIRFGGQEVVGFPGLSGGNEGPVGIPVDPPATTSPSSTPPAEERPNRRRSWFSPFGSSLSSEERPDEPTPPTASNPVSTSSPEERQTRRRSWFSPFSSAPSPNPSPTDERRNPIRRMLHRASSTTNTVPTPRSPATAVVLSREQFMNSPNPSAEAAEGSFERFLADLGTDVGVALLRASVEGMAMSQSRDRASALPTESQEGPEAAARDQEFLESTVEQQESRQASQDTQESQANQQQSAVPRFAFFRSYQFANRLMSPSGELSDLPDDGSLDREAGTGQAEPEATSDAHAQPTRTGESSEEAFIQSIANQPARPSLPLRTTSDQPMYAAGSSAVNDTASASDRGQTASASEDTPNPSSSSTPEGTIATPLLFVGVRRIHLRPSGTPSTTPSDTPDAPNPSESPEHPLPQDEDEGIPMSDLFGATTDEEGIAVGSGDLSTDAETARIMRTGRSEHFLLWIAGGIYPRDHPILTLPALLAAIDSNASYEELLRLGELMGTAKSNTATQEDVAKSDLKVVDGREVEVLTELGLVLANAADKCRVCLEDYEPEDKVRLLECKHAFHRDCIDKWLTTGRNECPMCRSTGVPKAAGESEPAQVASVEL